MSRVTGNWVCVPAGGSGNEEAADAFSSGNSHTVRPPGISLYADLGPRLIDISEEGLENQLANLAASAPPGYWLPITSVECLEERVFGTWFALAAHSVGAHSARSIFFEYVVVLVREQPQERRINVWVWHQDEFPQAQPIFALDRSRQWIVGDSQPLRIGWLTPEPSARQEALVNVQWVFLLGKIRMIGRLGTPLRY